MIRWRFDARRAAGTLACSAALLAGLFAARVAAQTAESDIRSSAAQALFEEGRALLQAERWDEACPKLAESQRIEPAAGTLLNLAFCYERAGKPATAWLRYNDALVLAVRNGQRERQEIARARIDALEPKLSTLVLVATEHPEGLWIALDGVRLGAEALDTAVPVDPGTHELKVGAPGKRTATVAVSVEGEATRVEVSLPALEADPAALAAPHRPMDAPAARTGTDLRDVLQGAALGVGVSGLLVGGLFGLRAKSEWDDRNEHCKSGCDARAVAYGESAQTSALVSTIATSVGLGALAAGLYLLLTEQATDEEPKAKLQMSAGPDHAWVGAASRF
jgi:hypothetical protein